jgi:signal transduction histidine kinase
VKLTLRFLLLVAALLVGVAASAASGYYALARLDSALDAVVKTDMERLLAITHSRRLFRSMVVLERDYLLSTSAEERKGMDKKMATAAKDLEEQIGKYAQLMPAEDRAAIEGIRGARSRWIERDQRVREAARKGDPEALKLAALHSKDPVSWEASIGKLVKANEARLAKQVAGTHETYVTARTRLFAVSCLAALFAAGFGSLIFRGIRRNMNEVVELNTNLEGLVKVRTEALAARERSLRLVLDSTGDGIVGVKHDRTVSEGTSAAAERWFGVPAPGTALADYLFAGDERQRGLFNVALDQLLDGLLPWEVSVDQMLRRFRHGDLTLELEYKQVQAEGSELSMLVVVRDVTARVKSELSEQAAREQQSLVSKLLSDKQGFAAFVAEVERIFSALGTEQDLAVIQRHLHTLKGNVAIFGLASLAERFHALESRIEESGEAPTAGEVLELNDAFREKLHSIDDFLSGVSRNVYEVETDDHNALIESLLARKDYQDILGMVELWTWPRTSEHLARLRSQIEYVAKRLEKQVDVAIEHNDLRLPRDYLEQFWPTLVHVTRNAVDHGVEPSYERVEHGKPERATVRLRTWQIDGSFFLEIADDGAGIDPEAVRGAAEARGVELQPGQDPLELLFEDGMSTRQEVTDLSGRGVGLSAVRQACEAAGGRVLLTSELGKGTKMLFEFRRPILKTGALEQRVKRHWSLSPLRSDYDESATRVRVAQSVRAG